MELLWIAISVLGFSIFFSKKFSRFRYETKDSLLKSLFCLLVDLAVAVGYAYFLWGSIDFALNAKADTAGYYNLLGNKLLPYQVLPYRIIAFISIPLWSVGFLIFLKSALIEFGHLILDIKRSFLK